MKERLTRVRYIAESPTKKQEGCKCKLERTYDPRGLSGRHIQVLLYMRKGGEECTEVESIDKLHEAEDDQEEVLPRLRWGSGSGEPRHGSE